MFTGIIESIGTIERIERSGEGAKLAVEAGPVSEGVKRGDSVCVSGVCLTAVEIRPPRLVFDVNRETLERSTLASASPGGKVNLERALRAGDRMGGHFVQGHVDGVGAVRALRRKEGASLLEVGFDPDLLLLLVEKGSVAVDGVSLTVVDLLEDGFTATLIPETLEATTLGALSAGEGVNVEADILGKTVVRAVERILGRKPGAGGGISMEDLGRAGFV